MSDFDEVVVGYLFYRLNQPEKRLILDPGERVLNIRVRVYIWSSKPIEAF